MSVYSGFPEIFAVRILPKLYRFETWFTVKLRYISVIRFEVTWKLSEGRLIAYQESRAMPMYGLPT